MKIWQKRMTKTLISRHHLKLISLKTLFLQGDFETLLKKKTLDTGFERKDYIIYNFEFFYGV